MVDRRPNAQRPCSHDAVSVGGVIYVLGGWLGSDPTALVQTTTPASIGGHGLSRCPSRCRERVLPRSTADSGCRYTSLPSRSMSTAGRGPRPTRSRCLDMDWATWPSVPISTESGVARNLPCATSGPSMCSKWAEPPKLERAATVVGDDDGLTYGCARMVRCRALSNALRLAGRGWQ